MEHIPGIQNSWTQGTALASVDGCLTGSLDMVQRRRPSKSPKKLMKLKFPVRVFWTNCPADPFWGIRDILDTTTIDAGTGKTRFVHVQLEYVCINDLNPPQTLLPLATTLWGENPFVWKVCNHRLCQCSWIACIYCILNSIKSKPIWQTIGQTRSIRIRKMLDRWCALQGLQMLPQCGVNIADQISHQ